MGVVGNKNSCFAEYQLPVHTNQWDCMRMKIRKNPKPNQQLIGIHSLDKINKKLGPNHKLVPEKQMLVCELLAKGYTPSLVCKMLLDEHKIKVSLSSIYDNYLKSPRWQKVIRNYRRQMDLDIVNHPMASKAVRLNYLQEGLQEALTERVVKINHDKDTGAELSRIVAKSPGIIAPIIREIRAEVEGDQPIAVFNQTIDNSKKTLINLLHGNARDVKNQTPKKYKEGSYDGTMLRVA